MRFSLAVVIAAGCAHLAPGDSLGGTSWQLVKFQGGDGRVPTPDNGAKYTVAFGADGGLSVRFDCNRGRGTWKSFGPNQLEFGPMALTRHVRAWVAT
jgi:para-nitrobenzyl esterase